MEQDGGLGIKLTLSLMSRKLDGEQHLNGFGERNCLGAEL